VNDGMRLLHTIDFDDGNLVEGCAPDGARSLHNIRSAISTYLNNISTDGY
jgi:hypothetical protein